MTATVKAPIWAGPFVSGEIPLSMGLRFDSVDIDLSAYDLEATLEDYDGSEMVFAGAVVWDDATIGLVTLSLGEDDVAVPVGQLLVTRKLMVWAGNGANRVATLVIKYNCHKAVGTPPII